MTTLNTNVRLLQRLFEEAAPCTHFECEADLWQLGELIEAPSLSFRIARVASFLLYYLPSCCNRWYLEEIKIVVLTHRRGYFADLAVTAQNQPALQRCLQTPLLTLSLFQRIKKIIEDAPAPLLPPAPVAPAENRSSYFRLLDSISERFHAVLDEATRHRITQLRLFLFHNHAPLLPLQKSALSHIQAVTEELNEDPYPIHEARLILKTLFSMCAFHVDQKTIQQFRSLNSLKRHIKVWEGDIYTIKDNARASIAKWRAASPANLAEYIAYTLNRLFGGDDMASTILTSEGEIFQSLEATHPLGRETIAIQLFCTISLLSHRQESSNSNVVLQGNRLYAADKPYSRAFLKLFLWEGLEKKLTTFFDAHELYHSRHVLLTTLYQIRTIFRHESAKDEPTLTPKELYFHIQGQENVQNKVLDEVLYKMHDTVPYVNFPLRVLALDLETFDKTGWLAYKEKCMATKVPIDSFMLTTFLKGAQKEIVQKIGALYPLYLLDTTKDDALTVACPSALKDLDERIKALLERRDDWKKRAKTDKRLREQDYQRGASCLLFQVPEQDLDYKSYCTKMKAAGKTPYFASEITVENLSCRSRMLADFLYKTRANACSLDRHTMTLHRDTTNGKIWLNYEVPL